MKLKVIVSLFLLSTILNGCNQKNLKDVPELPPETEIMSETEAVSATMVIDQQDNQGIYQFYDEGVKKEVERYFDKEANELNEEDMALLSEFHAFIIDQPVETLKDIPALFPNIRYLNITYDNPLPQEDYAILAEMSSLRALTVYCEYIPDTGFAEGISYLEIQYSEERNLAEENNLTAFSMLGADFVNQHITGNPRKFMRIIDGNCIYELMVTDEMGTDDFFPAYERSIFVLEKDSEDIECKSIINVTNEWGSYPSNRIQIVDVDFDGNKDILLDNGHFGNQMAVKFTCFLNRDGAYEKCESFSEILNPAIDSENKKVLSTWRNWAASHSWAMYVYDGTNYVATEILTEALILSSDEEINSNEEVWEYSIRKQPGEEIETFTTRDYTSEQIYDKVYGENNDWALSSDKWNTLFNGGKMTDFSIYGNSYIDDTILDIISKE